MEEALTSLPSNERDAYESIIAQIKRSGISSMKRAFQALSWVFHAKRPLQMEELREALLVKEESDLDDSFKRGLLASDIVELCQSLIVHEKSSDIVRFTHATVQDWLLKSKSFEDLPSSVYLAKSCLVYLGLEFFIKPCHDETSLKELLRQYKFCRYAAQFWGFHSKGEAERCVAVQKAILALLESENKRNAILEMEANANLARGYISFTTGQTLLHVIAGNGLAGICRLVLDRQPHRPGNERYVFSVSMKVDSKSPRGSANSGPRGQRLGLGGAGR